MNFTEDFIESMKSESYYKFETFKKFIYVIML